MFYSIQYEKYYTLEREGEIICFDDGFDDFFQDEYEITMKEIESMEKGVEYVSGDIAIELYRKRYMLEKLFIGKKYGIEEVKHFCKKTLDDLGLYVVEYEVPQEDDPYTENGIGAYKRLEV